MKHRKPQAPLGASGMIVYTGSLGGAELKLPALLRIFTWSQIFNYTAAPFIGFNWWL